MFAYTRRASVHSSYIFADFAIDRCYQPRSESPCEVPRQPDDELVTAELSSGRYWAGLWRQWLIGSFPIRLVAFRLPDLARKSVYSANTCYIGNNYQFRLLLLCWVTGPYLVSLYCILR